MNATESSTPSGRLVQLERGHESLLKAFLAEFAHGLSEVHGYFLPFDTAFETVVTTLDAQSRGDDLPVGWVPQSTWFWLDEGEIQGVINLRHRLTPALEAFGGHIGYTVAPSKRRRGVATAMLKAVLPLSRSFGIEKLLVTCDTENLGSIAAIERNGGVLDKVEWTESLKRKTRFYWINL
ncbi:MAG: GNAT family N-acetyltransferase [Bradymonadia bacterium]